MFEEVIGSCKKLKLSKFNSREYPSASFLIGENGDIKCYNFNLILISSCFKTLLHVI